MAVKKECKNCECSFFVEFIGCATEEGYICDNDRSYNFGNHVDAENTCDSWAQDDFLHPKKEGD